MQCYKRIIMVLILQWNACSLIANGVEFKNYLNSLPQLPEVICVQETRLNENLDFRIKGYISVRYDRPRHLNNTSGGLAIFVRDTLKVYNVIRVTDCEALAVTINTSIGDLNIVNTYFSPNDDFNPQPLFSQFNSNKTIILGDFNAKSIIWGNSQADTRGKVIEDILDSSDVVILNDGSPTHFSYHGHTAIDITLCSPDISLISKWQTFDNTCGSDHYIISCELNLTSPQEVIRTVKWNFKRANWDTFIKNSEIYISEYEKLEGDTDTLCTNLTAAIIKAAEESIPKSNPSSKSNKYKTFWNQNCSAAVKEREKARKRFRKTNNLDDFINFKRCKAIANRNIKSDK